MIYMFLSNNPSSGDINSSNLPCLYLVVTKILFYTFYEYNSIMNRKFESRILKEQ